MNSLAPSSLQLGLLALSWLGYFIIHSWLASLRLKSFVAERYPSWMPAYRLTFNLIAVGLLLVPLELMYAWQGPSLWEWQGWMKTLSYALRIGAVFAVIWSLNYYDGQEFLGLHQLKAREKSVCDQEHFHISPLHRYVRHPWYFLALVFIWAGDMDAAWLTSAIMISLYFVLGSRLEEAKLRVYHGEVYARYARAVPGLVPLPWRYLSREEANIFRAARE